MASQPRVTYTGSLVAVIAAFVAATTPGPSVPESAPNATDHSSSSVVMSDKSSHQTDAVKTSRVAQESARREAREIRNGVTSIKARRYTSIKKSMNHVRNLPKGHVRFSILKDTAPTDTPDTNEQKRDKATH